MKDLDNINRNMLEFFACNLFSSHRLIMFLLMPAEL